MEVVFRSKESSDSYRGQLELQARSRVIEEGNGFTSSFNARSTRYEYVARYGLLCHKSTIEAVDWWSFMILNKECTTIVYMLNHARSYCPATCILFHE